MNTLAEKLCRIFEPIEPMDFYREIFPENELDTVDSMTPGKYTGIAIEILTQVDGSERVKRYTVTDDLDTIDELQSSQGFCVLAPVSYAGKSRKSENARYLYALVVELDNLIEKDGLDRLIRQWSKESHWLPKPTYVIASGTGLHLYYKFVQPIPLFPNIVKELKEYKRDLTVRVWNRHVTTSWTPEKIQQESVFQPFRMVGTLTKLGDKTEAFRTGDPVTMEYMNQFVEEDHTVTLVYKSDLTLSAAQQKYPEWYDRRIVQQQPKGHWICKRDLYDWWKRVIEDQAVVGHRYYCMMILAIYAVKCNIDREELEEDCWQLMKTFERRTDSDTNHFTKKDVISALQSFEDQGVYTYPLNSIVNRSGIQIQRNKRNGRKRSAHVYYMNTMKSMKKQLGEEVKEGRPDKKKIVRQWQRNHPGRTKADCNRATGIDPKTIRKWWKE